MQLMRDTQGVESETDRLMDSMSLEKERGITIVSVLSLDHVYLRGDPTHQHSHYSIYMLHTF